MDKFKRMALGLVILPALSDISCAQTQFLDSHKAICSMMQSARTSEKELGYFFTCSKTRCIFLKFDGKTSAYEILLQATDFTKALGKLKTYTAKNKIGKIRVLGFAHTHPNKSIKNLYRKIYAESLPKTGSYLSLAPSAADLRFHKYFSYHFSGKYTFKTVVVDSNLMWIVQSKYNVLSLSSDEVSEMAHTYSAIEVLSSSGLLNALKYGNGLYSMQDIKALQKEYLRLSIQLQVKRIKKTDCK